MKACILFLLLCVSLLSSADALPPEWTVTGQRAVIVSLEKPDPNAGGRFCVNVRCVDQHDKPTTDNKPSQGHYSLLFSGQTKIFGTTRSHGTKEITFDDLRVGQFVRFTGACCGGLVSPKTYKIFLP